ncbi:hypothetical protein JSE7799_01648 [Jannaschia seosinensis]|uniref:DUF4177 domain-containing protein n=1 Tax=Jannaschia seosinensis TaxID=313367 RepID=A0A0M7B9Q7_9RHOB|nr:hypothetical protein [Jannaschia seosinensis]CUH38929.1 hypothetical protein JSE7799_01648 [Jannaschia seosinensis]
MIRALPLFLMLALAAPAQAACYADYKAKRDDPLRLHYGVIELSENDCDLQAAATALRQRLGDGWQLLDVESVFGEDGLDQRRDGAGEYFLRY